MHNDLDAPDIKMEHSEDIPIIDVVKLEPEDYVQDFDAVPAVNGDETEEPSAKRVRYEGCDLNIVKDEVDPLLEDQAELSENTARTTKNVANLVVEFCSQVNIKNWDELPMDELDKLLICFYSKICKKDGSPYRSTSLSAFRYSISRHLQQKRNFNIITDKSFSNSNDVLRSIIKERKSVNAEKQEPKTKIRVSDIVTFYKQLDLNTPKGLQEKVLFDIMYYFSPSSRLKLKTMTTENIGFSADGRIVFYNEGQQTTSAKQFQKIMVASNGPHCPVASLKKYLSKLDQRIAEIWQLPLKKSRQIWADLDVWYEAKILGKNNIGSFMSTMSRKYGLSQVYTNQCCKPNSIDDTHTLRQLDTTNVLPESFSSEMVEPGSSDNISHTASTSEGQLPSASYAQQSSSSQSHSQTLLHPAVHTKLIKVTVANGSSKPFFNPLTSMTMPTHRPSHPPIHTMSAPMPATAIPTNPSLTLIPMMHKSTAYEKTVSIRPLKRLLPAPSSTSVCPSVNTSLSDSPDKMVIDISPISPENNNSQDSFGSLADISGIRNISSFQGIPSDFSRSAESGTIMSSSNDFISTSTSKASTSKDSELSRSSSTQQSSKKLRINTKFMHRHMSPGKGQVAKTTCSQASDLDNMDTVADVDTGMRTEHTVSSDCSEEQLNSLDAISSRVDTGEVEDAIVAYRDLARLPAVKSAALTNKATPGHLQLTSVWTQRDLERKEVVTFSRSHMVQLDVVVSTQPQELTKVELTAESPSGKLQAVIRKVPAKDGEDKQYIEVWNDSQKVQNICADSLDEHGKIYTDSSFGCLRWSYSETQLLYVAEKKRPKGKYYFEQKKEKSAEKDAEEGDTRGEEFVHTDDWGEQLTDKSHSVLCALDVLSGSVRVLDALPGDVSAAQAIWCPGDKGVVCVGIYHGPYRLGLIYCPIRRSALFHIDLKTEKCEVVGSSNQAVASPVFSPDGTKLVYLENEHGGPHFRCRRLKMCDWSTKGVVTVKDVVRRPNGVADFPGIFELSLNARCWSADSKRVILDSLWRSKQELLVIHCEEGVVTRLTNDPAVGVWTLQDIHNDIIIASCSSPNQPQYLALGHLPSAGKESGIKWTRLDDQTDNSIAGVSWSIHQMAVPPNRVNQQYAGLDYEYITLTPTSPAPGTKPPLVVFPHGGPHSVFSASMMLYPAVLCQLGFVIVCVNYRGSVGFGQDSVDSLPGNVGTQDVQDVQAAAVAAIETHGADPKRVVVMGGSHGGFLTAHLVGQYPDFYKAAVARNPVTNIASMVGATDIIDWTYVEAGVTNFDHRTIATPEMYKQAWDRSPIRYADQVKTPVLICLGLNDRRVPPAQGHEYRKALASRGVKVRMLCYPDNAHPIIKVDSEADCFINIVKWFRQYMDA